ncbi:MAG: hypothetical protein DDG59_04295 [Anaerolineae bacterium]|jgi:LCP family protein required for cell wall assembly|nr:MAG: hypothetical protein DDG59_04295 [Anaerolineae bacterium]
MNHPYRFVPYLLFVLLLLSGCALPNLTYLLPPLTQGFAQEMPAERAVAQNPNVTPSPTPFQPLPPTPVMTPTEIPTFTPEPSATPPPALETPAPDSTFIPTEAVGNLPKRLNILLLGSDRRPGGSLFRTDTIILVSIDTQKGMVHILSFPRDLYVYIPGWTQDRINVAWQHGGFEGLAATMQQNFGVRPTHYALVNFRSFKRVVDDLGGLDVKVSQPLYDKYPGKGWITIPKGKVHMDADMALWYVRSRKTSNDFARNRRQQEVLLALFEKFISLDALTRAPEFYKAYKKAVVTNLQFEDGLALLPIAAQVALDRSRIKHYFITPEMAYDYITPGGAMVLLPNETAIRKLVHQVVGGK